jgi:hypothetical protein
LELGDLLAQLLHLALQFGDASLLATRPLPFQTDQGPGHGVATHLL